MKREREATSPACIQYTLFFHATPFIKFCDEILACVVWFTGLVLHRLCNQKMSVTHRNAHICKVAVRRSLFVSGEKRGSGRSGGRRGWRSVLCPQRLHGALGKGDTSGETRGAKSNLQSCVWEKLGLISSILWSFVAAFHSSFPPVWWLWQSQNWAESGPGCLLIRVSIRMSSHSWSVAECGDCAKYEQTQQIKSPGVGLWAVKL